MVFNRTRVTFSQTLEKGKIWQNLPIIHIDYKIVAKNNSSKCVYTSVISNY